MITKMVCCGDVRGAACDLPGFGFPRCTRECARKPNRVGRCWCLFHEKYPTKVEVVARGGPREESFRGVLQPLKERGLVRHGVKFFEEGER